MADVANVRIEQNGYRNAIVRATLVSDGSGIAGPGQVIFNATSSGVYGVSKAGQTFYPGLHTTLVGLDYDIQDMKLRLMWEATANEDVLALGNAPEDFDWRRFGGIRVPSGLTGATGSIVVQTADQLVGATFSVVLYIRKNVPVS